MRCPCQDKPPEQRIGCTMCGGTGIASCCETERPTWAPRDADDQRPFPEGVPVRDCERPGGCTHPVMCSDFGRCHYGITEDLIGEHFARGLEAVRGILDKYGVRHP